MDFICLIPCFYDFCRNLIIVFSCFENSYCLTVMAPWDLDASLSFLPLLFHHTTLPCALCLFFVQWLHTSAQLSDLILTAVLDCSSYAI
jgi:hypothetical protein